MFLAQSEIPAPEIVWSSFAPEMLPVLAALVLLMFAVAGRRRMFVAVPTGIAFVAAGAWLVTQELVTPGAVSIAYGAFVVAATIGFAARPQLIHVWLGALSAAGALVLTIWQHVTILAPDGGAAVASLSMQGSVALDGIALFTRLTVYGTVLLVLPLGYGYLLDRGLLRPEYEPLVLLSAVGMTVLGTASDLITVFVAYEILSIALYILAGLARRDRRSQEASIKYFVTGAVTSAILLYGMALLYTATGTLDLGGIGQALQLITTPDRVAVLGLALVTVGLGFKIAVVPFQLWTPDVYQGSPTNVTAFMAAATKAAGFAIVLRLYFVSFAPLQDLWVPILGVLAAATMLYGAVVAIVQRDVKRMLAYSAIAHAGYAAIGVVSASPDGLSGTLWYLLTYAVTTMAAFGAVIAVERHRQGEVALVDLKGLGKTAPALAMIFALALLSFAGIPPTAGFAGKLAVFRAGVAAGLEWLVVIGVVSSVIAAFFYLRIIASMYLEEPEIETSVDEDTGEEVAVVPAILTTGLSASVAVAAALVIYLGIQPAIVLDLADKVAVLAR